MITNHTKVDTDEGNLNGMVSGRDIESLVLLRESAGEMLAQLSDNSPRAKIIREALSELDASHAAADHIAYCGRREFIRRRKVI